LGIRNDVEVQLTKLAWLGIALFLAVSPVFSSETARPFTLRDLDGDLVELKESLANGPVILDFWATWCKPCVKNLSKLQKLYAEYKDRGLGVLAINEDGPRSLSKVEPFARSLGLEFPILLDENRAVALRYGVSGFPATFVIDPKGEIILAVRGYRPGDEETVREKILFLLDEESGNR